MNSGLLDPNTLACTRHAAERAGRTFCIELGRDARNLRAIAWTAPLLGILGTVVLLKLAMREYALPGFGMCDCAGGIAETFVPIALSLPVSVLALVESQFLAQRVQILDFEMNIGILNLLDDLVRVPFAPISSLPPTK